MYLDVAVGENLVGRLYIELFTDKAPRSSDFFRCLCLGSFDNCGHYDLKGTQFKIKGQCAEIIPD